MAFSREEFMAVVGGDVRQAIEANIDRNPLDIALDSRIADAAIVATQVKRLQRAASKLPSYFAVRAILPPLAFEQSSSEACARRKRLSGESVADLTCGLGVDALALSQRFARVVAVERDEVLADTARENFARLGAKNIEVVNCSAEEFLDNAARRGERFDWCFADPDRRGEAGEKRVCLEQCSPDIVALHNQIAKVADRLCIKCSPMFDVAEAFRIFGLCRVETVSLNGECKEVNIYVGDCPTAELSAVMIDAEGEKSFSAAYPCANPWSGAVESVGEYRFLTLPDVALHHARVVGAAFHDCADVWNNNSVALSAEPPTGRLGRIFPILKALRFDERNLRRELHGRRVEIIRRDFPLSNAQLCKRLGIREGGDERWCFTRVGGTAYAFRLGERIKTE